MFCLDVGGNQPLNRKPDLTVQFRPILFFLNMNCSVRVRYAKIVVLLWLKGLSDIQKV